MKDLQYFNDWHAIAEGKARYCRCLDTKDWAGFADVFTEEFELDLSAAGSPTPLIRGRDAVVKSVQSSILTAKTAHQVHSPEMQIDGDEARVVWAMQDRVVWGPDRPSLVGYGHYHERWVKRNGQWRMAWQKLTRLHMDFIPPGGSPAVA